MDLRNKVVVVTGASRGIGRHLAVELGRRGASVVLAARTAEPRRTLPGTVGETLAMVEAAGGSGIAVRCDVAETADVEALVAAAVDAFGGIDIFVNNAADMIGGDFERVLERMLGKPKDESGRASGGPLDNWLRQFATNVHGPYLLMTLAAPHMRSRGGGVIVNVTSGAADLVDLDVALATPAANPSLGYAVTKAALNRLTNALAVTLAADNIAVVSLDPGAVHTEARDLLEGAGVSFSYAAAPMDVPVDAILRILTAVRPMAYSGQIVRAQP